MKTENVVRSDPEILSGEPVFAGTRVPFRALSEFPDDFPTGTREQAVAGLEEAGEAVSSELWKLIEERRREPTVSREELD